jgi:hypothetical protein
MLQVINEEDYFKMINIPDHIIKSALQSAILSKSAKSE